MRALVFEGAGTPLQLSVYNDPTPGFGDIVVKIHRCGICGSDLHMTSGEGSNFAAPCVLGHEFSGEVVALGAGAHRLVIGDRVAAMPLMSCGHCAACLSGAPNRCSKLDVSGCGNTPGGYAEYALAKDALCFKLPETVSYDEGALAEPMAVALRGVRMAPIGPESRVLVLGAGPIGLAAMFWAKHLGARKVAVAAPSRRREALSREMGADDFFSLDDNAVQSAADALGGAPDVVLECAGQVGLIQRAIELAALGATIVVLGYCNKPDTFRPTAAVGKEVIIRFSQIYDLRDYGDVIAMFASGAPEPRLMITDRIGLGQVPTVFEALRERTHQCKVLIDPWL